MKTIPLPFAATPAPPPSLVATVGTAPVLRVVQEFLELHAQSDVAQRAAINTAVVEFISSHPTMVASFFAKNRQLVETAPAVLTDLYVRAMGRCAEAHDRDYLTSVSARYGIASLLCPPGTAEQPADAPPAPRIVFTEAQERALEHLRGLARLHFDAPYTWGVQLRTSAWVLGPSGVGKSHLMRHLAQELGLRFLPVSVGTWIPIGARNGIPTLNLLRKVVAEGRRTLLFIDEFEKLRVDSSTWSTSVLTELLALLEFQPAADWRHEEAQRLRQTVWITAAATYQDLWRSPEKTPVGFGTSTPAEGDFQGVVDRVCKSDWIPPELQYRLAFPPAVLTPYTARDFQRICTSLGIPDGVVDIEAAVRSGRNMRALESAVAAHAAASLKDNFEL